MQAREAGVALVAGRVDGRDQLQGRPEGHRHDRGQAAEQGGEGDRQRRQRGQGSGDQGQQRSPDDAGAVEAGPERAQEGGRRVFGEHARGDRGHQGAREQQASNEHGAGHGERDQQVGIDEVVQELLRFLDGEHYTYNVQSPKMSGQILDKP